MYFIPDLFSKEEMDEECKQQILKQVEVGLYFEMEDIWEECMKRRRDTVCILIVSQSFEGGICIRFIA